MSKFPLTTAGVQDLINQLYALPQPELQIEANAVGSDFRLWVKTHFDLSATQEEYLEKIDQQWIDDASYSTKRFLENRLNIEFYKDEETNKNDDKDRGKLLDLDQRSVSSYSQIDGANIRGTLTYTISYPVL